MAKVLTSKKNAGDKKILEAMRQAQANLDIEGISVSAECDELILKSLRGEISHAEFLKSVAEIANRG